MARKVVQDDLPWDSPAREELLAGRVRDVYRAFCGYYLAPRIEPDACFPNFCDDRPWPPAHAAR